MPLPVKPIDRDVIEKAIRRQMDDAMHLNGIPEWDMTDYSKTRYLGQPRDRRPDFEAAIDAPAVMWLGMDWAKTNGWSTIYRRPLTLDEQKHNARLAGVIVCDCIWVEDQLTVWVPWCQAHGGGCSTCGHRHVRLDGF